MWAARRTSACPAAKAKTFAADHAGARVGRTALADRRTRRGNTPRPLAPVRTVSDGRTVRDETASCACGDAVRGLLHERSARRIFAVAAALSNDTASAVPTECGTGLVAAGNRGIWAAVPMAGSRGAGDASVRDSASGDRRPFAADYVLGIENKT